MLAVGSLLYVAATTGFGELISTFTRTQVSAVFATAILSIIPSVNFSGLLVPVASLSALETVDGVAEAQPFREGAHADRLVPGRRKAQAEQNAARRPGHTQCLGPDFELVAAILKPVRPRDQYLTSA